jgi:hypothetical protein
MADSITNTGKPVVFIGIDPGAKGSICVLAPNQNEVMFYPTTDKPFELLERILHLKETCDVKAIMIEDVHSIHGASAKSNFMFGYNVGVVNTLAQATGIMVMRVQPKVWQKHVGVKAKGNDIKKEVASICDRLYPAVTIRGPRGGLLDGCSDALMIAHYVAQTYVIHN